MLDVGRMAPKMPRTSAWSLEDSCFYVAVCLDGTNGWRRRRIVSELPSVEVGVELELGRLDRDSRGCV